MTVLKYSKCDDYDSNYTYTVNSEVFLQCMLIFYIESFFYFTYVLNISTIFSMAVTTSSYASKTIFSQEDILVAPGFLDKNLSSASKKFSKISGAGAISVLTVVYMEPSSFQPQFFGLNGGSS